MKYTGRNALTQVFHLIKNLFDSLPAVTKSGSYNDLKDKPDFVIANVQVTSDGVTSVSIPNTITSTNRLLVYHNGILIIKGTNYNVSTSTISLIGYSAKSNDIFTFINL